MKSRKKSGIPKLNNLKLKKAIMKPLDSNEADVQYKQITAEIENEYNDLLLPESNL